MFFQPHGLCFHILENKPHPVLSTHHDSFPQYKASPFTSPTPDPEPHKDPQPFYHPPQRPQLRCSFTPTPVVVEPEPLLQPIPPWLPLTCQVN